MKHRFDEALPLVLAHEGGYVNHPRDPGGPTNLGVTLATARRFGIDVDGDGDTDVADVKKLARAHAAVVYRRGYWDAVRGDELPAGVDYAVFDYAVNSGPARAAKDLQRVLGVEVDGMIGPVTLDAAHDADPATLVNDLCDRRLAFVQGLSTWSTFGRGWGRRIEGVREHAVAVAARAVTPPIPNDPGLAPSTPDAPPAPFSPTLEADFAMNIITGIIAHIVGGQASKAIASAIPGVLAGIFLGPQVLGEFQQGFVEGGAGPAAHMLGMALGGLFLGGVNAIVTWFAPKNREPKPADTEGA